MSRALSALQIIIVCVVIVLVVILALAVAAGRTRRATGGADADAGDDDADKISVEIGGHPGHGIGAALHKHALEMSDKDVIAVHNLTQPNYAEVVGGARAKAAKPWYDYPTWAALAKDKGAEAEYMKERARALNDLEFDWSQVLAAVNPLLDEDREYIGLISPDKDGKTLRVVAIEASPLKAGEDKNPNVFASIPSELVERMSARPATFIFHTHPADPRGSPLPSPADVSTAITMGYAGAYAANLVISRYGVILYTLGWQAYRDIHRAKSPGIAMRNMRYDVASALLGARSWADWSLEDYRKAYERHRLIFVVYPSAEYVAASHLLKFRSDLSSPSDFGFLDDLRESIEDYRKGKTSRKHPPEIR